MMELVTTADGRTLDAAADDRADALDLAALTQVVSAQSATRLSTLALHDDVAGHSAQWLPTAVGLLDGSADVAAETNHRLDNSGLQESW